MSDLFVVVAKASERIKQRRCAGGKCNTFCGQLAFYLCMYFIHKEGFFAQIILVNAPFF